MLLQTRPIFSCLLQQTASWLHSICFCIYHSQRFQTGNWVKLPLFSTVYFPSFFSCTVKPLNLRKPKARAKDFFKFNRYYKNEEKLANEPDHFNELSSPHIDHICVPFCRPIFFRVSGKRSSLCTWETNELKSYMEIRKGLGIPRKHIKSNFYALRN